MDQRQLTKRTANALERLERVEQSQGQVLGGLSQMQAQTSALVEVLDAVVELVGTEKVQVELAKQRREKAAKKAEAEKKQLDEMLLQGLLIPADEVTQTSIVVGQEKTKSGEVIHPGYVRLPWQGINPQFRDKFLKLKVGDKVDFPDGGSFEIQELYTLNPNPPKPEEKPAEAAPVPPADAPVATENPPAPAAEAAPAPTAPEAP